jgi:hypothetical protein
MQYMLLIYGDEQRWSQMPEETRNAFLGEFFAYSEALEQAGALVSGSALQPSATATVVRVEEGEPLLTDGPFAETKEQLGGYYLIDVETLDEALEWAARIPSAKVGQPVEVRPLQPAMARRAEASA